MHRVFYWAALCLGAVGFAASESFAHHSRANFSDATVIIRGEVTRVEWKNPHVYFFVREETADGAVDWQVEGQSTPGLLRRGWSPDALKPGDRVTLRGNPDRNSARRLIFPEFVTKTDGTTLRVQGPVLQTGDTSARATGIAGMWSAVGAPFDRSRPATHLPLTAKGRAAAARFDVRNDPFADCIPPQVPDSLSTPYLHEIIVRDDVVLLREEYWEVERVVYMDGREHPAGSPRTNQGHSIGYWEGSTLVVDTTLFDDHRFGNGSGIPSGAQKHIVERYSLDTDGRTLTISYVLTDPEFLAEPVEGSRSWRHTPGLEFLPNRCDLETARRYVD